MDATEVLSQLKVGNDLDTATAKSLMSHIMTGQLGDAEIVELILALKAKGEVASEVIGFVAAMLERTEPVELVDVCLDIVGTGGDQLGSVNISSTAAIIAAAAGVKVVKHGNRAASSKSGSADVLEALGIFLNMNAAQVKQSVDEVGIGFCFAPQFHPAMKNVAAARKQIGLPTIFNILGPLANPAQPTAMLVGVADSNRAELMAGVLAKRGCVGFIVRGDEGLDEITTTTTTTIWQFDESGTHKSKLNPTDYGIELTSSESLAGGTAVENAQILIDVLNPNMTNAKINSVRAAAILNAAGGILAFWLKTKVVQSPDRSAWQQAIAAATQAVQSGTAQQKLKQWQNFSSTLS